MSHHWQQAVAVWADLEDFSRRQVFQLGNLPGELIGYQGAAQCDLYSSRFRPDPACQPDGGAAKPAFAAAS